MKADDAPVFMKAVGTLLVLTSIVNIVYIFIGIVDSSYASELSVDISVVLWGSTAFCFIMIAMVYGILKRYRLCYVIWIVMAIIDIVWIFRYNPDIVNQIPAYIQIIDIAVLLAIPKVRRYCLTSEKPVLAEQSVSE